MGSKLFGMPLANVAIYFIATLVAAFVLVGNLRAIAQTFEDTRKRSKPWQCFLQVWGTTTWKMVLLFAIILMSTMILGGAMNRFSDIGFILFGLVFVASITGGVIGFLPAVAAGLGARSSESASKIAMGLVFSLEWLSMMAFMVANGDLN